MNPHAPAPTPQMVQARVDGILRLGMICSVLWLMGIGSAVAVVSGLKAQRLIRESGNPIAGMPRVRWCLVVGGIGLAVWVPVVIVGIVNNLGAR